MTDQRAGDFLDWFAQTKFIQPVLNNTTLARERLLTLLKEEVPQHRLTLISAPAGSGKTTLLAGLSRLPGEIPLSWFSVDEEDVPYQ